MAFTRLLDTYTAISAQLANTAHSRIAIRSHVPQDGIAHQVLLCAPNAKLATLVLLHQRCQDCALKVARYQARVTSPAILAQLELLATEECQTSVRTHNCQTRMPQLA